MGDQKRGDDIKRRRLALGINTYREFAEATERDKGTLQRAENGAASATTYDWLEAWLSREEAVKGVVPAEEEPVSPIRVTFHDVQSSSIGEIIVEGPSDHPDDLIETITRLLAEVRKGTQSPSE